MTFNFAQVGDLCYRKQTGSKVYDMLDNLAFREDLEVTTDIGINVTSTIIHQGTNFWIVNDIIGVTQCICTQIHEGFEGGDRVYYPVQYNWIDKMVFIGREVIGIEYISEVREVRLLLATIRPSSDEPLGVRAAPHVDGRGDGGHHQDVATLQRPPGLPWGSRYLSPVLGCISL